MGGHVHFRFGQCRSQPHRRARAEHLGGGKSGADRIAHSSAPQNQALDQSLPRQPSFPSLSSSLLLRSSRSARSWAGRSRSAKAACVENFFSDVRLTLPPAPPGARVPEFTEAPKNQFRVLSSWR